MVRLEDLKKSEMSDSFNEILSEIREITSDEEAQSKLLTARILKDFIKHSQNLRKNRGFLQPKKPSCSRARLVQKPMVIKRRRSHSETEEQEDHKARTCSSLQQPLKKRSYPRAYTVDREKTKTRTASDSDKTPVKELPTEMKKLIKSMEGRDIKLVIEKILSKTDCSKHHDRLTIPKAQAESEFLNEVEKHMMGEIYEHVIRVRVIEPCFEESYMCFRQLNMRKSSSYVLRSCWYTVRERPENKLIAGVKVQVWSFRVRGKLCFAIVRVGEAAEPEPQCSSTTADQENDN